MSVAALFVDTKRGPYPALLGLEACWDERRDARTYEGPGPVIVHPPCAVWCKLAKLNERRWGKKVGEDGGMFSAALTLVRKLGGVLEHPAHSLAWPAFGLHRAKRGEWLEAGGVWVTEVHQVAYGHEARKPTWLLYCGARPPFDLNWDSPTPTHQIGGGINTGHRQYPRLPDWKTHLTPEPFARELIRLAEWSRG